MPQRLEHDVADRLAGLARESPRQLRGFGVADVHLILHGRLPLQKYICTLAATALQQVGRMPLTPRGVAQKRFSLPRKAGSGGSSISVMLGFEGAGARQAEMVGLRRGERRVLHRRIEAGCAMTSVSPKSPPLKKSGARMTAATA